MSARPWSLFERFSGAVFLLFCVGMGSGFVYGLWAHVLRSGCLVSG